MSIVRPHLLLMLMACLTLSACDRQRENATPESQLGTAPVTKLVADIIYQNANVITMADEQPTAEAVAVRTGRIVAVGADEDMLDWRGDATRVIDLNENTLAPGFIDGHVHFAQLGVQAIGANLLAPPDGGVNTIDDLVASLRTFAQGGDVGRTGWVFGMGYDDSVLEEGRHPTRDDLDKVSTEIPVMAIHISGHLSVVNSKGLEVFGYNADTPDPEGGLIRRQAGSNEPNGVLEELASIPMVLKHISPRTPEDGKYFLERGLELAKSFGYTTAQEGRAFANTHQMLASYADSIGFDIDVASYIDYSDTSPLESKWYGAQYTNGYRVAGLKITLDGSPQGRTAWRTIPYQLPPEGQPGDYKGYPAIPDDQTVIDLVDKAYAKQWQVILHANGDAAVDQMLKAMSVAQNKHGPGDRRNTLIHGQYVRQDQLETMAELQMSASLFPMHTFYWGDWHTQLIGEELGKKISPTRSALDLGLPLTSHTDAPVALPNLMQVVWATVNRTSRSGKVIGESERLTPLEAMKTITIWAARQHFEEDDKGSIEVGKLADLVVLSDNPLEIAPERLNQIEVLETIKAGETVWGR